MNNCLHTFSRFQILQNGENLTARYPLHLAPAPHDRNNSPLATEYMNVKSGGKSNRPISNWYLSHKLKWKFTERKVSVTWPSVKNFPFFPRLMSMWISTVGYSYLKQRQLSNSRPAKAHFHCFIAAITTRMISVDVNHVCSRRAHALLAQSIKG